jgi:curved DNA-binding protein CbpA
MDPIDIERIFEWDSLIDQSTYYEVLGLLEIADTEAVRKAFHEFAVAFHPDAFPEADQETADALLRIFQRGAEAYRVLSRSDSRADYDLALAKGLLRLDDTIAPAPLARESDIRSLDELCRSPAARRYAKRAEDLISSGDLSSAKRELQMALREDGENPDLVERLDAIDLALFAMGR